MRQVDADNGIGNDTAFSDISPQIP